MDLPSFYDLTIKKGNKKRGNVSMGHTLNSFNI